ncbi:MAG: hypothetical protein K6B46_04185 [Opitutales bacterium]|nr:hypothetical protein [Opitutales bacterium]
MKTTTRQFFENRPRERRDCGNRLSIAAQKKSVPARLYAHGNALCRVSRLFFD